MTPPHPHYPPHPQHTHTHTLAQLFKPSLLCPTVVSPCLLPVASPSDLSPWLPQTGRPRGLVSPLPLLASRWLGMSRRA